MGKAIVAAPNADTKGVEAVIQGSSEVISKLIDSVTKLAGAVGNTGISEGTDAGTNAGGNAVAANKDSVKAVIEGVKSIIEIAEKSGIKIEKGKDGTEVVGGDATAPAALVGKAAAAAPDANSGPKLVAEVVKADPWAMIDKIKNAKTKDGALSGMVQEN